MKKFQKIYEKIMNENPQTRFKKAMYGVLPDVKSFMIVTPENPMGVKISKKENMSKIEEFKKYLKDGRHKYLRVKGKYNDKENPFAIFNISISNAKNISNNLNQESFIYAYNKDKKQTTKNVMFEYWEKKGDSPYKKLDSIDYFEFKDNAEDFFTRMKSWKFNIPFPMFEELFKHDLYNKELNEDVVDCINEITSEILIDNKTLKHQYTLRGHINACVNNDKIYSELP